MKALQERLLKLFRVEASEHLEAIRTALATLDETRPGERLPQLEEGFRRAHSLKGAARAVGWKIAEASAHHLETLFAQIREGRRVVDTELQRLTGELLDALGEMVRGSTDGLSSSGTEAWSRLAHLLGEELPPEALDPPEARSSASSGPAGDETLRVSGESLDRLMEVAAEMAVESLRQGRLGEEMDELAREVGRIERALEAARSTGGPPAEELREARRAAGEISRRLRRLRSRHRQSTWALRLLSTGLQNELLETRMVPARFLIEGFRRMVRELAAAEGKELELVAEGIDVRADREIFHAVKDAVMHLLRNAVTHGIERPEERRSRGKDPVGRVWLRLDAEGRRLKVVVEDDGGGLSRERLQEAARRAGLVSEAELEKASDEEIYGLVFEPGLTTSNRITELSGRGMGLSVVAELARRLQGAVAVEPREGGGTRFSLWVPLTVAAQRLVLVACGGATYGIPAHAIERLVRFRQDEAQSVDGWTTVFVNGKRTPVLRLSYVLGLNGGEDGATDEDTAAIVLRSGPRRGALAVKELLGELEGVVQHLGTRLSRVRSVSGAVLLDDGTVSLVLNPSELLDRFRRMAPAPIWPEEKPGPTPAPPTILVVDDSMTTRTLEKTLLEAHGYRVLIAVDGVEAWSRLQTNAVDLVVADIQMPRLDGLGLLERMKKDRRLENIPVVIVSSIESPEQQKKGLQLGADAYIVKRRFEQRELIDTIRRLL